MTKPTSLRPGKKMLVSSILIIFLVLIALPFFLKAQYKSMTTTGKDVPGVASSTPKVKQASHIKTPEAVKGIYMTACVAGTPSWRESLKKFISTTELNSVVIDIKDYSGTISFVDPSLQANDVTGCRVRDMREFIEELHKENIYVIGRLTVFQDPYYTKLHPELAVKSQSTGGVWKDHKGLAFIDVGAKPYWEYVVKLSKASYDLGFDEINFDYIRYPSDGNMKDTSYTWTIASSTKPQMLKSFFSYLHNELKDTGVKTSADLFGMTTTATDDLGIGQVLGDALLYFDFIDPMVYPSHYPATWNGFKKPAEHPYEVIKLAMEGGVAKARAASTTPAKLRPWIQDFDLGATYNAAEVRAQIQATYDVGLTSWLSWDASNKYTQDAYLPE
jgi:hypothetical protein